jgi:hypothetical protein
LAVTQRIGHQAQHQGEGAEQDDVENGEHDTGLDVPDRAGDELPRFPQGAQRFPHRIDLEATGTASFYTLDHVNHPSVDRLDRRVIRSRHF